MTLNSKLAFVLMILLFLKSSIAQESSNTQKLDDMIVQGIKDWKIPGLAATVVKDGQVVFQKNLRR